MGEGSNTGEGEAMNEGDISNCDWGGVGGMNVSGPIPLSCWSKPAACRRDEKWVNHLS